jgi:quercetin 2,3-dioxygenase
VALLVIDVETKRIACRVHPHRDAEIFSYILDGELTHQDSMGNKESLMRGEVQYLSAGSGITHSEMNEGKERCRFIQVLTAA